MPNKKNLTLIKEISLEKCDSLLLKENGVKKWSKIKQRIISGDYLLFEINKSYVVLSINYKDGKKSLEVITGVALNSVLPTILSIKSLAFNLKCNFLKVFACRSGLAKIYRNLKFKSIAKDSNGEQFILYLDN